MPNNRKTFSFIILALVILLNIFWLPSTSWWGQYHLSRDTQKQANLTVLNYQHPLVPVVKTTVLPVLQAQAYVLIDNDTNTVLASKNLNLRIYPASTTKLATALTALNLYPLDEVIDIKQEYKEGKIMSLQLGEKITVRNLVTALLVHSANDAAFNLANHHPGGYAGFIDQMNLIAQKNNLNNTHFTNYDGIHNSNHYSSVYDLSQIARLSINNPVVTEVVKTKQITVTDIGSSISHHLVNTNELLGVLPEIEGLKTGWTPEAGGSFVGLINVGGHKLISVVAQSDDRFADTRILVDWAKANLTWEKYQP